MCPALLFAHLWFTSTSFVLVPVQGTSTIVTCEADPYPPLSRDQSKRIALTEPFKTPLFGAIHFRAVAESIISQSIPSFVCIRFYQHSGLAITNTNWISKDERNVVCDM